MGDEDRTRQKVKARAIFAAQTLENLLAELGSPTNKEIQIFGLLGGSVRTIGKSSRLVIEYLRGDGEREARRTLANLLRSDEPLSRELRDLLAALFDPDLSQLADGTPIERQLVFRRRSRSSEFHRDFLIRFLMAMLVGAGVSIEDALRGVGQELRIEPGAVRKVWEKSRRAKPSPTLPARSRRKQGR